jgi:hypothetical protein
MSTMVRVLLEPDDIALVNDALAKVTRLAQGDATVLVDAWQGRQRLDKAVNDFPEGMMLDATFRPPAAPSGIPAAWPADGCFGFADGRGMLLALDLWYRVAGMGQFGDLGCVWQSFGWAEARQFAQVFAGAIEGQSFGIMSPEVPDGHRRLCEIHDALRHRLHWTFAPPADGLAYFTHHQPAWSMTDRPLPVAEVVVPDEACDFCARPLGHCHGVHS